MNNHNATELTNLLNKASHDLDLEGLEQIAFTALANLFFELAFRGYKVQVPPQKINDAIRRLQKDLPESAVYAASRDFTELTELDIALNNTPTSTSTH
jgi:hypothetical protein